MSADNKVVDIRPKEIIYCPQCGWGKYMYTQDIYQCDKCTRWFTPKDLEEEKDYD